MKAPDILGLVIRIAGFLLVLYGLWYVLYGVESIPSIFTGHSDDSGESPLGYLEFGVPTCVVGTVFFLFADWFVGLSYRGKHD